MDFNRREFLGASALFGAQALDAAEFWDKTPFPDWSADQVDRLVTDSPWAKPVTVAFEYRPVKRFGSEQATNFSDQRLPQGTGLPGGVGIPGIPGVGWPGGGRQPGSGTPGAQIPRRGGSGQGTPARTEIYLTLRWSSALPVRQALAMQRWGKAGLESTEAREFLARNPDAYEIDIFGFPAMIMTGTESLEKDLAKSAAMEMKKHGAKVAREVEVPPQGEHLSAKLLFDRMANLGANDGSVEFTAATGTMKIRCKFVLKEMMYQGQLAV